MNTTRRSCISRRQVLICCALVVASFTWAAGELVASRTAGWPQWRGVKRDGVITEKGLVAAWPEGGPALRWSVDGIGHGYSSPVIANDTVFITGDAGSELHISAYTLDGKLKWKTTNGKLWRRPFPGARSSCTYDEGRIYHMNAHGRVACLDAATGKEQWSVNVLETFEGKNITWGLSESLLIIDDKVVATPAGAKGLMVALNKKTGETVWASEPLEGEQACYSSPILLDFGTRRQIVNCGSRHCFGIDPEKGKLLWTIPHSDPKNNIAPTPVFHGDSVYITNASRDYGALYRVRINPARGTAEKVWFKEYKIGHGGMVCVGGTLYGANGGQGPKGWIAVDTATGDAASLGITLGGGSLVAVNGLLYCLAQEGDIALLRPTKGGCTETGRFSPARPKRKDFWAHPVVWGGRLWLRCGETLFCYDIGE